MFDRKWNFLFFFFFIVAFLKRCIYTIVSISATVRIRIFKFIKFIKFSCFLFIDHPRMKIERRDPIEPTITTRYPYIIRSFTHIGKRTYLVIVIESAAHKLAALKIDLQHAIICLLNSLFIDRCLITIRTKRIYKDITLFHPPFSSTQYPKKDLLSSPIYRRTRWSSHRETILDRCHQLCDSQSGIPRNKSGPLIYR